MGYLFEKQFKGGCNPQKELMKSLGYLFIYLFAKRWGEVFTKNLVFLEALTKAGGEEEATQYFLSVVPHQLGMQMSTHLTTVSQKKGKKRKI